MMVVVGAWQVWWVMPGILVAVVDGLQVSWWLGGWGSGDRGGRGGWMAGVVVDGSLWQAWWWLGA